MEDAGVFGRGLTTLQAQRVRLRHWDALPGRALRRRKCGAALAANAQRYRAKPWSVSPDNDSVGKAWSQNYHAPLSMTSLFLSLSLSLSLSRIAVS